MPQCTLIANCATYSQDDCSCSACKERFNRGENGWSCMVRVSASTRMTYSCICAVAFFSAANRQLSCRKCTFRCRCSVLSTAPTARPWLRMDAVAISARQGGMRTTLLGPAIRCDVVTETGMVERSAAVAAAALCCLLFRGHNEWQDAHRPHH